MTEKLYYKDAYISHFEATVLGCEPHESGFAIILDKTAFFPEEGGQSSDRGKIGDSRVLDVQEIGNKIYHYTDKPQTVGARVPCRLDFEERFEKMQLHTAEHIVCGIIHSLWGYENVGFHLGFDVVTFDISAPMTRQMLDRVEDEANFVVSHNLAVYASFPTPAELSKMTYRSKLDITDGVRIVTVEGVDMCACCAPHVSSTGEIGIIKLLDFEKHRGGTRIYLTAGRCALLDYRKRYEQTRSISGMLSVPQAEVDTAVSELIAERDRLRYLLKEAELLSVRRLADTTPPVELCEVFCIPDASVELLREFCNEMCKKSEGLTVAVSGSDSAYRYVMARPFGNISPDVSAANAALSGKGGGRGAMATGTFSARIEDIRKHFATVIK